MNNYTLLEKLMYCGTMSFLPFGMIMWFGYCDKQAKWDKGAIKGLFLGFFSAFCILMLILYLGEKSR